MQKRVLVSVTSDIVTDQRVLRTAELIGKSGSEIIVIGRRLPVSPDSDRLPFRCIRYSMLFSKGFLFYKFFNLRLLFTLLSRKADLLVANDLDTLLPNYLVSVIKRIPLVYDAHEYFTGTPDLEKRPFVRGVWKFIERMIIPRLKHMITVNESIAALYKEEYGIEPVVMHNYSRPFTGTAASREELGIPGEDLLCVLQGTGINRGRGGEEAMEALLHVDRVHLLIIGRGDTLKEMRDRVPDLNLTERVTFLPVMMWEDMMCHTAMCDAGLSLDAGSSTNSRFSLPNKIFDYMEAGLAIIATELPEVSEVINTAGCGIVIAGNSALEIASAMRQLRDNRSLLKQLRDNSVAGRSRWSRESEEEKVRDVYRAAQLTF
jgi:glycosyltransferase involved in cell wall biosynthesis